MLPPPRIKASIFKFLWVPPGPQPLSQTTESSPHTALPKVKRTYYMVMLRLIPNSLVNYCNTKGPISVCPQNMSQRGLAAAPHRWLLFAGYPGFQKLSFRGLHPLELCRSKSGMPMSLQETWPAQLQSWGLHWAASQVEDRGWEGEQRVTRTRNRQGRESWRLTSIHFTAYPCFTTECTKEFNFYTMCSFSHQIPVKWG